MTDRTLPVLDLVAPGAAAGSPPRQAAATDRAIAEFVTDDLVQPRFHVWTLGCQMNRSDSEEMAGALLAAGCSEAGSLEAADLVVINTCAIREAAEQKVIGRMGVLGRLKATNPRLRIVLTGCSVQADNRSGLSRRYPAVDLFLRPDEEPELAARLGLLAPTSPGLLGPAATMARVGRGTAATADRLTVTRAAAVSGERVARGSATHAWLPIIYGCDKTCTYCIVPFSRGPERSRSFDDILEEARSLAAAGYQEVTLLGQNVNSWGHDLPAEPRFAHVRAARQLGRDLPLDGRPDIALLLRAIDALRTADGAPAIPRLRFITSHPWDLGERLIAAIAESPSVCEHLHLPVQSGDDAVLRRMGRQYTADAYLRLVERLRDAIPGIALTTDVIVGFCGETLDQHEATLALLREVGYDAVFAAAFSPRPGTPAARLADDVPAGEKRRRLNELLALQETIGHERNLAWVGRTTEVLFDELRPARAHHDHEAPGSEAAGERPASGPQLTGRNRENKLVHAIGPGSWWAGAWPSPSSAPDRTPSWGASWSPTTPDRSPPLLVLAGATATGKTRLALELAVRLGPAEIIGADSRQVYRGMDIGTAKVDIADRARIPHHGLDLVDPDAPFTVADFQRHAIDALTGIAARGAIAILVGGTGLYLRVVARGLPISDTGHDPIVRAELEARLTSDGLAGLVRELRVRAPDLSARTDLSNPRRVVRALERVRVSGDQPPPRPTGYPGPVVWLGLRLPREVHDREILDRARAQFDAGLVHEAASLRALYGDQPRAFSAMGYREAFALLDGRCDRETAIADDAARTRLYAKRQATWFRGEPGIAWLPEGALQLPAAVEAAERTLDARGRPRRPDALC